MCVPTRVSQVHVCQVYMADALCFASIAETTKLNCLTFGSVKRRPLLVLKLCTRSVCVRGFGGHSPAKARAMLS